MRWAVAAYVELVRRQLHSPGALGRLLRVQPPMTRGEVFDAACEGVDTARSQWPDDALEALRAARARGLGGLGRQGAQRAGRESAVGVDGVENEQFFQQLAAHWKRHHAGWTAWVLTPDAKLGQAMRLKESRRVPMWNGPIECRLFRFDLVAGSARG